MPSRAPRSSVHPQSAVRDSQLPDPRALPARYELAALATGEEAPAVALQRVLQVIVAALRADAGSVALLNPDTGRLETEVQMGQPEAGERYELKPGQGVTGWCLLNRRSLLVPDVALEPRYIGVRPTARCEMAVPLQDGEQVLGIIDLESDRAGFFSPADLELLEQLAAEAARVMQRLWQREHLQEKARQLESLINAGQSLVTKHDQQELLATLAAQARQMRPGLAAALYLYDSHSATVHLASFDGPAAGPTPDQPVPLDSSLAASAILTRHQVTFADIQSAEYRELADVPAGTGLLSALATPMIFEGEVRGVLAIFTGRPHRFANDEKRLCAALAGLGAVALENARLYARIFASEETLRKNERLTTLGLLAAEIAHEIRNPLTVLKLLHGGLGADFAADDPRRTDLRVISEKLDQLEAIVTRVLNFAAAPTSLHSRWSLTEIIEDTLVLVRLKLAQSRVALRFDRPAQPLLVNAHKGQIQQVLLNLLLNATQAMPDGGTITLTAAREELAGVAHAALEITDSGRGVPAEVRDRIFDSFLSSRPGGTGLGLAIAKRILVGHHGDILLRRTGADGTTMRVVLPLA